MTIQARPTASSVHKKKVAPLRNRQGLLYTLFSIIVIIGGTYLAIRWAQGDFRVDESADLIAKETGLLHATSTPKGAEVYIDGKLTSITDNTIYLSPGEYDVQIIKDGYNSWNKRIRIEKALVSQTNATLYPYSPNITSITFTGVINPLASPDGSKVLFYTNTASAKNKNGLYVLDATNLGRSPQQICDDDADYDLAHAQIVWSPDSNEVLVVTPPKTLLLNTSRFVNLQSSPDISLQLTQTLDSWEADLALRESQFAEKIPLSALDTIRENSKNMFLSPDQTKILYVATGSATIPSGLISSLPATNSQPEVRRLEPGKLFIYDSYEDKNYLIGDAIATDSAKMLLTTPVPISNRPFTTTEIAHRSLQATDLTATIDNFTNYYGSDATQQWVWMPDSTHLLSTNDNQIIIMTYDGSNPTAVYSGPFVNDFVMPAPDNNSILTLTSFNPSSPNNIYAIELNK
ncbi:PEGA domain-containing protein [bacterium]|nr:PEGA domain-containing protein [bacterium]